MATHNIEQKIELTGAQEYNKSLGDAKRNLSLLRAELRSTAAGFTEATTAKERNRANVESLNKQYQQQQAIVAATEKRVKELEEEYGENSKQVIQMKTKLADAKTEMLKTQKQLKTLDDEYKKLE